MYGIFSLIFSSLSAGYKLALLIWLLATLACVVCIVAPFRRWPPLVSLAYLK